ncbi:MAG: hypothetical protein ACK5ZG_02325 [Phycisphaerae bacterium]|jgi:hypothetical protein
MRRTHTGVLAIVSTMAVTSLALAQTGVSIPEVVYSVGVTTLTGRQGSVSGPESFSEGPIPGAVSAQGGVFGKQFTSSVGPVLPGQIISLPGTEGVATASSLARITVTPLTNACTIRLQVNNNHSVINMDGGGYLATGGGFTSVTIHVRETTSYTLTGTLALDSEDATAYMQFVGQPIFIVPSGNGPINFTGTLAPGYYTLRSGTASSAPLFPQNTGNDADSSSLDLLLTLDKPLVANDCDTIDFNRNGVFPEDQDVIDFFDVLAGGTCPFCADIDFNNNGVFPEDQDVVDFFNVLAGGECP